MLKTRKGLGIRLVVTMVCLGCLTWAIAQQGRQLLELTPSGGDWWFLLAGVLFSSLAVAVNGVAWAMLLRWLRCPLPTAEAVAIFTQTNGLKYIPGGIWHLVGRIQLLQSKGYSWGQAILSVLLDPLLMVIAALLLLPLGGWQQGLGLVGPLAVLSLVPAWRDPLLKRLVRRVPVPQAKLMGATAGLQLLGPFPGGPLLGEMAFVLVRYVGFAFCAHGFLPPGVPPGPLIAAFALAWTAGLVVPGAPAGLGVFELVLVLRLGGLVQEESALLATALSYRVVSTMGDAMAAAAGAVLGKLRGKPPRLPGFLCFSSWQRRPPDQGSGSGPLDPGLD